MEHGKRPCYASEPTHEHPNRSDRTKVIGGLESTPAGWAQKNTAQWPCWIESTGPPVRPENGTAQRLFFFSRLAAFFSAGVFSGAFLVCFLESWFLAMVVLVFEGEWENRAAGPLRPERRAAAARIGLLLFIGRSLGFGGLLRRDERLLLAVRVV